MLTRGGSSPRMACAVIDLPEPDSPTMQTISLAFTSNDRSLTACRRSPLPGNSTLRLRTCSSGCVEPASSVAASVRASYREFIGGSLAG